VRIAGSVFVEHFLADGGGHQPRHFGGDLVAILAAVLHGAGEALTVAQVNIKGALLHAAGKKLLLH